MQQQLDSSHRQFKLLAVRNEEPNMNNIADRPVKRQYVPPDRGRAIGAILVEQGRLGAQDVDEIQRFANAHGVRFGEAAGEGSPMTSSPLINLKAKRSNRCARCAAN